MAAAGPFRSGGGPVYASSETPDLQAAGDGWYDQCCRCAALPRTGFSAASPPSAPGPKMSVAQHADPRRVETAHQLDELAARLALHVADENPREIHHQGSGRSRLVRVTPGAESENGVIRPTCWSRQTWAIRIRLQAPGSAGAGKTSTRIATKRATHD